MLFYYRVHSSREESHGPLGSYTEHVHKRSTKEEVIEMLCSIYSNQGIAEFSDPEKAPEAMKKYVEDKFLKKLMAR